MKAVVLVVIGACTADDGGPSLTDVTPASAAAGASVALTGERFCGTRADCVGVAAKVELGIDAPIVVAPVLAYAATSATIQVPMLAAAGATELVLTVDGRSSNALPFEVIR